MTFPTLHGTSLLGDDVELPAELPADAAVQPAR